MITPVDRLRGIANSSFLRLPTDTRKLLLDIADHMDEQATQIKILNRVGGMEVPHSDLESRVSALEERIRGLATKMEVEDQMIHLRSTIANQIR